MDVEQQKVIRIALVWFLIASMASYGDAQDCPDLPCLPDKPLILGNERLTIRLYYHEDGTQEQYYLWLQICKLVEEFGGLVRVDLRAGALTTRVNGALACGTRCYDDLLQACMGFVNSSYFTSCQPINVKQTDLDFCMEYVKSDTIILTNGRERVKAGIPACHVPTVTFNDKYDPCVPLGNYDEFKRYVCDLFINDVPQCS